MNLAKTFLFALALSCIQNAAAQVDSPDLPAPPDSLRAPVPALPDLAAAATASPYTVVERGPHHRRWQNVVAITQPSGRTIYQTNSYVELETGMHTRDAAGNWVDAGDQVDLQPAGGALSRNAGHRLYFPGNLYADALQCATPDGKLLVTRPVGLSYFDGATNLFVAQLRDGPVGQLLPTGNQVLYTNLCTGPRLDLLVRNKKAGYESDLVIREALPDPADFGLTKTNVRVQWWTEFFNPPTPARTARTLANGDTDETLDFGDLKMARGKAWLEGETGAPRREIPVTKRWVTTDGRTFLVEEIPWPILAAQLTGLPVRTAAVSPREKMGSPATTGASGSGSATGAKAAEDGRTDTDIPLRTDERFSVLPSPMPFWRGAYATYKACPAPLWRACENPAPVLAAFPLPAFRPPPQRDLARSTAKLVTANVDAPPPPGFVLDYDLYQAQTNFTFQSDTTYFTTNTVNLFGTTTIEGGAVIKFETNTAAQLVLKSRELVCKTAPMRPAIFTSKNDNSVGTTVTGSTGTPTNYCGAAAINVDDVGSPMTFSGLRVFHLAAAFPLDFGDYVFNDVQITHCGTGLLLDGEAWLRNVLLFNVSTGLHCVLDPCFLHAENATFHQVAKLCNLQAHENYQDGDFIEEDVFLFNATNTIFSDIANFGAPIHPSSSVTNVPSSVFQTVGAAGHYLANSSPYRNAGTTNINPILLAALKQKTTYPPTVFYNQILTNSLALSPQAQRDIDAPDLGYHYDPIDYAFGHVWLQNAAITVAPGTVLGTFANAPGYYGLAFASGANFTCQGAPNQFNRIVRVNLVQEQANTNWAIVGESLSGPWMPISVTPQALFRFTDFSAAAQETYHFRNYPWDPLTISFTDCQFHGGQVMVQGALAATNCLFERAWLNLNGSDAEFDLQFRNNLFFGGKLELAQETGGTWTFTDNLFDHATLLQNNVPVVHGYNGYLAGSAAFSPPNTNDVVATLAWQSGELGDYYQPTNSPFINKGSVTDAANAGLFHYTTATNQVKEANSRLDIGLHYLAVDSNGNPLDTDGDGIPDYLEDLNGNGVINVAETPFGITIENPVNGAVITK